MSDTRSARSDFSSEADRAEMQRHLKLIAGFSLADNRKAALRFAASVLKIPHDRVRRLYYGEARRIEAHEADRIRSCVETAQKVIDARAEYDAARKEYVAAVSGGPQVAAQSVVGVAAETEAAPAPVAKRAAR